MTEYFGVLVESAEGSQQNWTGADPHDEFPAVALYAGTRPDLSVAGAGKAEHEAAQHRAWAPLPPVFCWPLASSCPAVACSPAPPAERVVPVRADQDPFGRPIGWPYPPREGRGGSAG